MYLEVLNHEERGLFFGFAYTLANCDGDYSAEERAVMAEYEREMQMDFDEETMVKPVDEIIDKLNKTADVRVKKIVIFEATGLAMADNNYDDNERKLISGMESVFNLEPGFGDRCESILKEYISFQERINSFILG